MSNDIENLATFLPQYLSADDQKVLLDNLSAISQGDENVPYSLSDYDDQHGDRMLQGDGWRGFRAYVFQQDEVKSLRGLVLSNSCDVAPENPRATPPRVTFAPLVRLAKFEELLLASGINQHAIDAKIAAIKAQKTSNVFYIPQGGKVDEEYLVRLDEAHSMPLSIHNGVEEREKLFTLSNAGFYMLAFKLSVHFCRLQENVQRDAIAG